MKNQLFKIAQELTDLANQIDELQAALEQMTNVKELQAKALIFAMGELDMTLEEMLDAANAREKQALFTDEEDVLPTVEELTELAKQDSEQLTDSQKHWYYASSTNPMFNPYLDSENC